MSTRARDCPRLASVVVRIVHEVMSSSGFVVNYGEGKSTLLFGLEGAGKGSVQAELAAMKGPFQ
eukprot:1267105-Pyramimonas_sp.AAC.1